MFEAAELGRKVSKEDFRAQAPAVRADLLALQTRLRAASFPVIVVFAGVDGAGKGETVNLLNAWMDPRWITTRAFGPPSDEEQERPEYWRYWRELPARGRIGLFLGSWYSKPVLDRVYRRIGNGAFEKRLAEIVEFERMLADDGALILKFWMHLGREAQRTRLEMLERNPLTRWRVTKREWKHWRMYDRFIAAAERTIDRTSRGDAPWTIVEGVDEEYRVLAVTSILRDAIRERLDAERQGAGPGGDGHVVALPSAATVPERLRGRVSRSRVSILAHLDMTKKLARPKYEVQLERFQGRLNLLQRRAADAGVSTILVFEGWDAAGKGGAIRRVTGALDARWYQVIPVAAPTDEERAHHYLWRFWRHLTRAGRVAIFDRSWYGRVLVERVEGLASERQWMNAYSEINQFEEQLAAHGIVIVKFWLHITKDEQLRRFRERQQVAHKRWKLTDEDWRNRKRWNDYEMAVTDMVERTSTQHAPWTLVEANDKLYARITVLKTICERLKDALDD